MRIRGYAVVVASLTLSGVAGAQSVGKMLQSDFSNVGKDVWAVWTAPFDASGRDWMLFAGALGVTGLSMFVDKPVERWAQSHDSAYGLMPLEPLRRGGVLFAGKYVVPPVAAVYVLGIVMQNQSMRDGVMGCGATWLAQGAVRKGLYRVVGRARPTISPDDPHRWQVPNEGDWDHRSFPAGHFANAVGCAAFLNNRFEMGIVEPALYTLAAGVGVGRLLDHAHWTSDTVLGGILGYAVGREIAQRSLARKSARVASGASLSVSPDVGGVTMSLQWKF